MEKGHFLSKFVNNWGTICCIIWCAFSERVFLRLVSQML
jgi:hypothetical protein